jgi:hypothetical protein
MGNPEEDEYTTEAETSPTPASKKLFQETNNTIPAHLTTLREPDPEATEPEPDRKEEQVEEGVETVTPVTPKNL